MHHADINSKYSCLSYVWGRPKPKHRIAVNRKLVKVRQNLLDFLEQASRLRPWQLFCIDALCINQHSISERNHQVQQMGLISHNAEEVIAWLGTEEGIARFLEHPEDTGDDFYDFWNSEYWNRAWITQEVILARRLILMAGDKTLKIDKLLECAHLLDHDIRPAYERFRILDPTALSSFKDMSLLQLLNVFKLKECEHTRDRIFSLLALCDEGSNVRVDYSRSREEILKHVLSRCPKSLCWCSVKLLRHILRVHNTSPSGKADGERPFAQFTVPLGHREEELRTAPACITVDLGSLCNAGYSSILQITPELDLRSDGTAPRWQASWQKERYYGACTVSIADDQSHVTIRLPFSTLLEIVAGISADGICGTFTEGALQLCGDIKDDLGFAAVIELIITKPVLREMDDDLRNLIDGHVRIGRIAQ